MVYSFSWERTGKLLTGVLAAIAAIATIYGTAIARPASLTAEITYETQVPPRQFVERLMQAGEKYRYKTVYDKIHSISGSSLDHQKIDAITKYTHDSYFSIFDEPFEKGPQQYDLLVFIDVHNNSNKAAKDIVINFPEPALVQVEDETGGNLFQDHVIPSVKLTSIGPLNHAKVWAYFAGFTKKQFDDPVRISHADGVAKIYVNETFNGFDVAVARNSLLIAIIGGVLFTFSVASFFLLVFNGNDQKKLKE